MRKKEQVKEAADAAVRELLQAHPGVWWRVVDVARAVNLVQSAANNSLRRLWARGDIDREEAMKRRRDCCRNGAIYGRYPIYRASLLHFAPGHYPAWMLPTEIIIPYDRIVGLRIRKSL